MKAGRELDSLIATKVFGMKVYPQGNWVAGPVFKIDPMGVGFMNEISVPHYSTDIRDAWDLVDFLKTAERYLEIISHKGDPRWICRVVDGSKIATGAGGLTAPLAICMAALKIRSSHP